MAIGIKIRDFEEVDTGEFVLILSFDNESFGIKVDELIDVTNIYEGDIIFLEPDSFK